MYILVIHSHNGNRGDEAAVRAMVDEILKKFPDVNIVISNTDGTPYPNMPRQVSQIERMPKHESKIAQIEFFLIIASKGKICFTKEGKNFIKALNNCDLVIHAPGGPSIGDIYHEREWLYLQRLNLVRRKGIPYIFYAPSMGPFEQRCHDRLRKKVLAGADKVILRDPVSASHVKRFLPELEVEQALDSALQHDICESYVQDAYNTYSSLLAFIKTHRKIIGITITDLKWHPVHKSNPIISRIEPIFQEFIDEIIEQGYGVIFIPQLYGHANDTVIMEKYMKEKHTFMIDAFQEKYDSYFQQFVISKLYAVVGMRYHSNIFSAKMRIPFISVSYEQKMKGFMNSVGLDEYCIDINDISLVRLNEKFNLLVESYETYKNRLNNLHEYLRTESRKSTSAVEELLNKYR